MTNQPPELDKAAHYGRYYLGEDQRLKSQQRRDDLGHRLVCKSLDIPEGGQDDVNVNVQRGVGWPELATIGGLVLAAVMAWGWIRHLDRQAQQPQAPTPAAGDTDSVILLDFAE